MPLDTDHEHDHPSSTHSAPQPSQDSASLLKRLAGPSSGKAGLTKDQTGINRIIAETSKGSKFYENEKRKDKDLTEKISKILKERDEVLKDVDLQKVEAHVDRMISELESQRDLTQVIVHVDMDAFYANVELLHNPELKGKPFGVGRGVLTTASYEARKFGVRSGMAGDFFDAPVCDSPDRMLSPGFIAKKLCPDIILLPINFSRYSEMSDKVMAIFARYDPNMCPAGCDEGYLNITEYCAEHNITPEDCVQEMRRVVFEDTKLTVSAGIAPNRMLAKTCGDIFINRGVISLLDKHFGLRYLLQTYLGIASNVVKPHSREERKSIGAERTFNPIQDRELILDKLEEVAVELENDMTQGGWTGRTVTLKYKLDTYQVFTRAKSFDRWITKKEELFTTGKELLLPELPLTLRLIGLRVTKLKDLRAAVDPEVGIKRFFNIADGSTRSPEKKRKKLALNENDEEEPQPFFLDENESDNMDRISGNDILRSRPPMSAPVQSPSHMLDALGGTKVSLKPKSTSSVSAQRSSNRVSLDQKAYSSEIAASEASEGARGEMNQVCPICNKTLQVDNQGLNAHIDFCLSRGAIREAQTEGAGGAGSAGKLPKSKSQNKEGLNWFMKDPGKGKPRSKGR
uniref:DNA polymerase kappa n=1 Tax=Moniliophthora roreri TaxID=221103 RepID=A0A0W0F0C4_MONRR